MNSVIQKLTADQAPGWPGIEARWTSSAKCGVGTALGANGRLWFSISHGILNEIYYPRVDQACTRDMGLLVTDRADFFSEEKRHTRQQIASLAQGVPAYHLTNTCLQDRYQIEKEVLADPVREVVLQRIRFTPLRGALTDYSLFALLSPHLGNSGAGNSARLGAFKGVPMLFAQRDGVALALACSTNWLQRSVGFVGVSDGWQDLSRHRHMAWSYASANNGNVALTAEIDLASCQGSFILALGFGRTCEEAGHRAAASLWEGFDPALTKYCRDWQDWQSTLLPLHPDTPGGRDIYRVSTAVLRSHESARFPGAIIASLSIPWGFSKGDGDLGGYHLVWPRDLVETAGGLLAAGANDEVRRVLRYLAITQEDDGYWPQNMWVDGRPYWEGIQMDETGFPILLVELALRYGAIDSSTAAQYWPMVRRAASFLVRNGPVTQQDRWEEDPGYSPFTLAVEVAALLCAADLADALDPGIARHLRETADTWNSAIERWTYVTGGELAQQAGVEGYYVRIAPPESAEGPSPTLGYVPIKNRPPGQSTTPASHIISPDALALVRFGLRAADDPRIVNTIRAIDTLLRFEAPQGPLWRRYNGDGYGEHEDGEPFDGTGTGRPWPLLTGERAHYELAAGRLEQARALAATLSNCGNEGGFLPEQIWDADDLSRHELFRGRPSGSAMPLVWAHAEYIKLCRSLTDGKVFDMPPQPVQRYQVERQVSDLAIWRHNNKCQHIPAGKRLRLELRRPALVHWSADDWLTTTDTASYDTTLGIHLVDLPTAYLTGGTRLVFTIYWTGSDHWETEDFLVTIESTPELQV
ncbi:MAG: glucan 1,4-alpha-glucosidase [Halioglobus sp.]|nr:glucan 1,4-alpha-glucosidase [Halioglobus sp.]